MSNKTIKIGQLDMELQSIFSAFEHHVHTAVDTAAEKTAEEAVKKLKKTSPKNKRAKRGKKYKNGWKYKKTSEGMTVYNEQYQLTHLLEHGHDVVINGVVKKKRAEAQPHIAPVEAWAQDKFPEEFKRQVEKG
jgi:hypothetical protein